MDPRSSGQAHPERAFSSVSLAPAASEISHQSPHLHPSVFPLFNSLLQSPEYLEALEKSYSSEKNTYYSSYKPRKDAAHRRRSGRSGTASSGSSAGQAKKKEAVLESEVVHEVVESAAQRARRRRQARQSGMSWIEVADSGAMAPNGEAQAVRAREAADHSDGVYLEKRHKGRSKGSLSESTLLRPKLHSHVSEPTMTVARDSKQESRVSHSSHTPRSTFPSADSTRGPRHLPHESTSSLPLSLPLSTQSSHPLPSISDTFKSLTRMLSRSSRRITSRAGSHRSPSWTRPRTRSQGASSFGNEVMTFDDDDDRSTSSSWFTGQTSAPSEPHHRSVPSTPKTQSSRPPTLPLPLSNPFLYEDLTPSRPQNAGMESFAPLNKTISLPAATSGAELAEGGYWTYGGRVELVEAVLPKNGRKRQWWKRWRSKSPKVESRPASALA